LKNHGLAATATPFRHCREGGTGYTTDYVGCKVIPLPLSFGQMPLILFHETASAPILYESKANIGPWANLFYGKGIRFTATGVVPNINKAAILRE
jgi:hypothetical protein